MATYEYRCDTCEKNVELSFKFGEAPQATPCPECKADMRKTFGNVSTAVIFKGTGWAGKR